MQHNLHCYCRQRHRAELVRTHADTSPPTIQAQTQPTHRLIFRRSLNSFAGAAASPPPAGPPAAAHAPAGAPAVAHAPVAAPAVAASATNATQHIVSSADRQMRRPLYHSIQSNPNCKCTWFIGLHSCFIRLNLESCYSLGLKNQPQRPSKKKKPQPSLPAALYKSTLIRHISTLQIYI